MFKTRIRVSDILRKQPFLLVLISMIFASFVAFIDALVDYFFYYDETFIEVFLPSFSSHEFYMRMMLILTVGLFGFMITFLFRNNLKYQETLSRNEFLFKTVANYTKDWEYWITPENKINFISPSCLKITGYTSEEFIKNPDLIYSLICEEDKQIYQSHDNNQICDREIESLEYRIKNKSGELIWIGHTCTAIYNEHDKYLGQRVSNRVITKAKIAEQEKEKLSNELRKANILLASNIAQRTKELDELFSQSPFAKALISTNKIILETNNAWDRMFKPISEKFTGEPLSSFSYFNDLELENIIDSVVNDVVPKSSNPIYIEEIDRMVTVDFYPFTNAKGTISKIVSSIEDITAKIEKAESDKELEIQKDTIKTFFNFFEGARKKLSQELHDQVGQKLLLTKLYTELLKEKHPESSDKFDEITNLILNTNSEIKEIIYSLHPVELENYGLVDALQSMISHCSKVGNFTPEVKLIGKYHQASKDIELGIYRICQETLNNITKHSKASKVEIEFHFNDQILVGIITDNGIGFDVNRTLKQNNQEHVFGLSSIQGRVNYLNGNLEINSFPNKGTIIHFEIPIEEN